VPGAPKEPTTKEERRGVAGTCIDRMGLSIPCVVDNMENTTERDYRAWPDRMYVVGADGKIAYRGGRGPRGFKPAEAEAALKDVLAKEGGKRKAY